ncbi:S24 family peptidase [Agrobacterium sp. CNPSo 3708]|uniref:LexA family protein n=1 Tax=Agrobacterium sp. CNPSo 3708 TaxID=3028150 RepID=UPI0023645D64|nr:LexA family transcriptional regulator [Agrobacterium sp. CNPSo 3708]MDD1498840.1 S24 family peptidase [Agrobacterium sp. CNPSo 3708]
MGIVGENLRSIRKIKSLSQVRVAELSGVSQQLISQLETGLTEKTTELPALARALGVGVHELDPSYTPDAEGIPTLSVPYLAWVSAGAMIRDDIADEALGLIRVADLPASGDWIALKVSGDSMDRISPPDSIIFVNRSDRNLVPNGCYVISDVEGNATYKRYRSGPMRFEPVSTNPQHEPIFPDNDPIIVGRVRRSIVDI